MLIDLHTFVITILFSLGPIIFEFFDTAYLAKFLNIYFFGWLLIRIDNMHLIRTSLDKFLDFVEETVAEWAQGLGERAERQKRRQ